MQRQIAVALLLVAPGAARAQDAPVDHRALEPQAAEPLLPGRRRPGAVRPTLEEEVRQDNPGAVAPPPAEAFPLAELPVPDRWRLVTALCPDALYRGIQAVCHGKTDPYHQNVLKGDRPLDPAKWPLIRGDDWFLALSAVSDSIAEPRSFPVPVGVPTTERPGSNDTFGRADSLLLGETVTFGASLFKGQTAFKPPEIEYRLAIAVSYTYATASERGLLSIRTSQAPHRSDGFVGVQEAFVDKHLRNVSDRYDFDAIRVGIQPFQADFRGFLFNDQPLGIRLFGNRDGNRWQYNLALFVRLEKDTNSGLNDLSQAPRRDYLAVANLYRQDLPFPGIISQITAIYDRDREAGDIHYDHNGFPVRPAEIGNLRGRDYDVVYLGYSADGHVGRVNLTASVYGALGSDRDDVFTGRRAAVRSFFAAAEPSYDLGWLRLRLSALYASGDRDPYDGTETGFDAILENPIFAGADTSYWIRQSVPFVGGGRAIGINGRNGVLADLRSSKDQGQSNFANPGTVLLGGGADADVLPTLRVSANVNHLAFATTEVIEVLRHQANVPHTIGWDCSGSLIWRPRMTQNIVFRLSGAVLAAGRGFTALFAQPGGGSLYHSVLANAMLVF